MEMLRGFFICVFLLYLTHAATPGIKLGLNKQGLQFALTKAVDQLERELLQANVPSIVKSGYKIEDIKITKFLKPQPSININPGFGLMVRLSNGALEMRARWALKLWFWWLRGSLHVASTSTSLDIFLGASARNGKPLLVASSCVASLEGFKARTSDSGFSWLLNFLLGIVNGYIKGRVESMLCNNLENLVNIKANNELTKLNLVPTVTKGIKVDLHLTTRPEFLADHIEFNLKGRATEDLGSVFNPAPMTLLPGKMLSASISEEGIQSVLNVAYQRKLFDFHYRVTNELIVNLFSNNGNPMYSNFSLTSPVEISVRPSGASISSLYEAVFTNPKLVLKMKGNISAKAEIIETNDVFNLQISFLDIQVGFIYPSTPAVDIIANYLVEVMEPFWNKEFEDNYKFPQIFGLTFKNIILKPSNEQMLISLDVQ